MARRGLTDGILVRQTDLLFVMVEHSELVGLIGDTLSLSLRINDAVTDTDANKRDLDSSWNTAHLPDLVASGRDVFASIGLSSKVKVVVLEIREQLEELRDGAVEVGGDLLLVSGEAPHILRVTEALQ
jgi:hypothetical protein